MATKNKNSKKQSNNIAATIFTFVLSLALVAIIFFGIFVLIYDPLKDSGGDKRMKPKRLMLKKI
jgi:hypothetical protein